MDKFNSPVLRIGLKKTIKLCIIKDKKKTVHIKKKNPKRLCIMKAKKELCIMKAKKKNCA
jgi:hypothetical protein